MSGIEWAAIATFVSVCGAALSGVLHTVFQSRCKTINLCCGLLACTREPPDVTPQEGDEQSGALTELSDLRLVQSPVRRQEAAPS